MTITLKQPNDNLLTTNPFKAKNAQTETTGNNGSAQLSLKLNIV